jgi:hypothetical protein
VHRQRELDLGRRDEVDDDAVLVEDGEDLGEEAVRDGLLVAPDVEDEDVGSRADVLRFASCTASADSLVAAWSTELWSSGKITVPCPCGFSTFLMRMGMLALMTCSIVKG